MAFYVGQRVICVRGGVVVEANKLAPTPLDLPQQGAIYTIAQVIVDTETYFAIQELNLRTHWLSTRFRPVVSRPTNISIFTAMLNPKPKVDA